MKPRRPSNKQKPFLESLLGFIVLPPLFFVAFLATWHTASQSPRSLLLHQFILSPLPSQPKIAEKVMAQKPNEAFSFDDLELVRLLGSGYINYGFEARLQNQTVVAKIAGDRYLGYTAMELDLLQRLNRPPTIPTIPKLLLGIRSMPNPYSNQTHLERDLQMKRHQAKYLLMYHKIGIVVIPKVSGSMRPVSISQFRRFLRSLLQTLEFAHSRNVMHCDLHAGNVHYDGADTVSVIDWNGSTLFRPNAVPIHVEAEVKWLVPPEGWGNASAVHQTVSGFDIYGIGVWVTQWLQRKRRPVQDKAMMELVKHFANWAKTADPFLRPTASQLLQHDFLAHLDSE